MDALGPLGQSQMDISGYVRDYVDAVIDQWLLVAPLSNPAILEMFRDRDAPPLRPLLPWSGEFAGKYLTGAAQVLALTRDERLRSHLEWFVPELLRFQDADGYLGPFPKWTRPYGFTPDKWDLWGHYHACIGLLKWHEQSGDQAALDAAAGISDLMCRAVDRSPLAVLDFGWPEMNLAPVHSLALMARLTGVSRYRKSAERIVDAFAAQSADGKPRAGDWLRRALAGGEYHEMPFRRWEALHTVMGLAELHRVTGDAQLATAFARLWASMLRGDRHSNGGYSSGEQAVGNPFDQLPIETCCTIAWMSLSVEMLKLGGQGVVADELEMSTLNSVIGMHSRSGRWCTYNTPMDGYRRIFADGVFFQMTAGSPELNCCSVNSPRGFGLLSEWALQAAGDAVVLNWLGPATATLDHPALGRATLETLTRYPVSDQLTVVVSPERPAQAEIRIRQPHWAPNAAYTINGKPFRPEVRNGYAVFSRRWAAEDCIGISLGFQPQVWTGERELAGKAAVYHGPLLLAFDHRYNLQHAPKDRELYGFDAGYAAGPNGSMDSRFLNMKGTRLAPPALDWGKLSLAPAEWDGWLPPALLMECRGAGGEEIRLCDFGSAGEAGTPYNSWLPMRNAPAPVDFCLERPSRRQGLPA